MKQMRFAPLRYALAIIRFPKIMQMERHVPAFQDKIRKAYPLDSDQMNQGLTANVGPDGLQFGAVSEKIWQFADAERSHALILGPDFLLMHAGKGYIDHENFLDRLRDAAVELAGLPELGITQVGAIGYRFIDLVEPRPSENETLAQYLKPWALPTAAGDFDGTDIQMQEAAYFASFKTPSGFLRFQALRRPQGAFPPDLNTAFVRANGWIEEVVSEDYVLLDIDHFAGFETLLPFNPVDLRVRLEAMYGSSRKVFESAATDYAFKVWDRKK
jgi:uncharacterized protein (TIGR04255 family)